MFIFSVLNYFVAPPLGLLLIFGGITNMRQHGFTSSSVVSLLPALAITLLPLWLHLYLRYRFKTSRVSNGPCVIDFDENHVVTEMPGFSKSTVEWIAVKKYREAKRVLLIYVTRTSFIAVPRRAFGGEQYRELLSLLDQKLSSRG